MGTRDRLHNEFVVAKLGSLRVGSPSTWGLGGGCVEDMQKQTMCQEAAQLPLRGLRQALASKRASAQCAQCARVARHRTPKGSSRCWNSKNKNSFLVVPVFLPIIRCVPDVNAPARRALDLHNAIRQLRIGFDDLDCFI
jgi:hypothetical protein